MSVRSSLSARINSLARLAGGRPVVEGQHNGHKFVVWSRRPLYTLVGVITIAAVIGWSVYWIPNYQGEAWKSELSGRERPLFVNEARRTILQAIGGAVLFTGVYFGWRRIILADETNRIERERQVTERFTRAVDQLGHGEVAVRLGGIYALERIAKDSQPDAWTIVEVLSAFVRQQRKKRFWGGNEAEDPRPVAPDVSIDVQAALTVLGRRPHAEQEPIDKHIDLSGADLREYDFSHGNFARCVAEDTWFSGATFKDANFSGANLERSDLAGSEADRARFNGAHAVGSVWRNARICQATFDDASLGCAVLDAVVALKARFDGAYLFSARFREARLESATFEPTRGPFDRVTATDLSEADLSGADLQGAKLRHALGVTSGMIADCQVDEHTELPEGIERPARSSR